MLCFKYPPLLIPKDPFWRWNRGLKFYDLIQGSNGGKLERLFMIWFCILRSCDLPCVWSPNWVWFEMWGYKFQCLKFGWADMKCLWEYFTFHTSSKRINWRLNRTQNMMRLETHSIIIVYQSGAFYDEEPTKIGVGRLGMGQTTWVEVKCKYCKRCWEFPVWG